MRIALLHFTAPPVIGGVERVLEEQGRALAAAGHQVTVIAGPELAVADLRARLGGQEFVFVHNILTMPFRPEVTAALWQLAAQMPQVRFVAWTHDVVAANRDYSLDEVPDRELFRSASPHFTYVAVSELRRQQLHETMGLPPERCQVIPNGIFPLDHWQLPSAWSGLVRNARLLERELLLLHPARLVRRKNVELSLQVTAALRQSGVDVALLVTAPRDVHHPASARYEREVRALHQQLGLAEHAFFLSDVQLLGTADVQAFYRVADAVFFPSRQEGFGLPVLEAALHRTPVFAPAIAPLTKIAPPGTHFYPPEWRAMEIAHFIRRHAEGSGAIQARRRVVQEYAWPAIYRKYIAPLLSSTSEFAQP